MKKNILLIFVLCCFYSCSEKINITFTEFSIEHKKHAIIEINAPLADVNSEVGSRINAKIQNHIANVLNFGEDDSNIILGDALVKFDSIYTAFKDDFEEMPLVWEALIDGEVTYQSQELICVAINSYLNTGGAHGNMRISFLNFNAQTGQLQENDALVKMDGFIKLAEIHFNNYVKTLSKENDFNDYFWDKSFHLPENIGFSEEGVILLYNVYEIAPFSEGIVKFIIPIEEVLPLLKLY